MSRFEILRGLVIEKMTVAVQEILAVVETTVAGYENDCLMLKQELSQHKKQLHTILQPRVSLVRIVGDHGEAPQILSSASADVISKEELENASKVTGMEDCESPETCEGENGEDVTPKVPHEDSSSTHEESDCTLATQSKNGSASKPLEKDEDLKNDTKDDDGGAPQILSIVSTHEMSKDELENTPKITDTEDCTSSEKSEGENGEEVTPKVSHEDSSLTQEESGCTLATQPKEDSATKPSEKKENLKNDTKDDEQNTRVKRKRLLPRRYRPDNCDSEKNKNHDRKPNKNKNLQFTMKKGQMIKLRVGLWKNCAEMDLSNNVALKSPVKTLFCRQNISKPEFLNHLRSIFPDLEENKPFEAFLADSTKRSIPNLTNRMTHNALYTTFRSHKQKQFDFFLQLKEQEGTCDTSMNTGISALDDQPTTSGLEEEMATETRITNKPALTCLDSTDQSEEDLDDTDFEPEQNNTDEENSIFESVEKIQKQRRHKIFSGSCKVCGYLFKSKTILVKHAHSHMEQSECKCGVCGQQLESSEELKNHLETHRKLHCCDTCGRVFVGLGAFRKHISIHKVEMQFKCCVCQEVFASDEMLKEHHLHHNNNAPNKCDSLPKSVQSEQKPHDQSKTQIKKKLYFCDECGKSFTSFRSLCQHKVIHTGTKNYSCPECGKVFYTYQFLKNHETIHAVRENKYVCDMCSKSFMSKNSLRNHRRIHEESHIIKCNVCDKLIKGSFEKHMWIHTGEKKFICKECGKAFRHRHHYKNHLNSHLGLKPFACTVCSYRCSRKHHLVSHMRIHTGEKPYKCTLCDMAYTQSHCLKTHLKRHHSEAQAQ